MARQAPATSYAFARRPRWIVLHVLLVGAVSLFAVAGLWQLQRLRDRRADNAAVLAQRRLPAVGDLDEAEPHRRAKLEGTYEPDAEIVLLGRGGNGRPGDHLLTPLVIGDRSILVDRGWVPKGATAGSRPPGGRVLVEGLLLPPEERGPFAPSAGGDIRTISRIDLPRIAGEIGPGSRRDVGSLSRDVYLLLDEQRPEQRELPAPVEPADLSEGSHLVYSVQWFCFIPIALAVYVALLRREAGRREPS